MGTLTLRLDKACHKKKYYVERKGTIVLYDVEKKATARIELRSSLLTNPTLPEYIIR